MPEHEIDVDKIAAAILVLRATSGDVSHPADELVTLYSKLLRKLRELESDKE
jgi:hypothetical protein